MKYLIKKFGTIKENEDGTLLIKDFVIDVKDSESIKTMESLMLEAIIERLQTELEKCKK